MKEFKNYLLLQLDDCRNTTDIHKLMFRPLDEAEKHLLKVDPANYKTVYAGEIPDTINTSNASQVLEYLYRIFNRFHPADFLGRSMSVSDIVILDKGGERYAYYCDAIGFKLLSDFSWPDMVHVETREVWLRLGVQVSVTESELREMVAQTNVGEQILRDRILNGRFALSGETYAPDNSSEKSYLTWCHPEFGFDF